MFHEFNEGLSHVLQLVAFAVFGALVAATGFEGDVPALAGFVAIALAGSSGASVSTVRGLTSTGRERRRR